MTNPEEQAAPRAIDPLWFKDAIIYALHVKTFADGNGDGIGDFKGLSARAGLSRVARRDLSVASSVLRVAASRRWLRHRALRAGRSAVRFARRLQGLSGGRPRQRAQGHHGAGHQPYLRPASLVPGSPAGAGGFAEARFLRLERHHRAVCRGARDLSRDRGLELDVGPDRRSVLLAPFLSPSTGLELRESAGQARGDRK